MPTKDLSCSFPSRSFGSRELSSGLYEPVTDDKITSATRTRTGTRLPNWHKIIEDGGNATTAMTAVWDTDDSEPANCYVRYNNNGNKNDWGIRRNSGDIVLHNTDRIMPRFNPSVSSTFVDNLARANFYGKLRDVNTQFYGITALGELRETAKMLRRPAAALWGKANGYYDALSKAKRASPKHWTKTLSGLWLEHSFGWLPLINDAKDIVKAYHRLHEKPKSKIISAGSKKSYDRSSELVPGNWTAGTEYRTRFCNGGCKFDGTARLIEHVAVRYKGKIAARVGAPRWDNWALFGFTPSEFAPSAWELMPWSFLVDYFTNIGDIISATCTSDATVCFVNRTEIHFTDYQMRFWLDAKETARTSIAFNNGKLEGSYGSGGSCRKTRRTVSRQPNSGISLPRLQLSWDLSDGQLGNIAALLGQSRALHPQNAPRPYRFGGRP